MSAPKSRTFVAAVLAAVAVAVAGCGITSEEPVGQFNTLEPSSEPSPIETSSEPSPIETLPEPPVTEETPEPNTETGDAEWFASANSACQQAISDYRQAKAASQSQEPAVMQLVAATAAEGVVKTLASLPDPPSALAETFKDSVEAYVASQRELATAMDDGSLEAYDQASSENEAAVKALVAAAKDAGADSCVAMTNEI